MATIKVYDQEKQEVGSVELAPEVFEVEARPEILNLVVRAQRAAQRAGTHKAKTRAFVSGSPGSRRAPVVPVPVRTAPPSGVAVRLSSDPFPAITPSRSTARSVLWPCAWLFPAVWPATTFWS